MSVRGRICIVLSGGLLLTSAVILWREQQDEIRTQEAQRLLRRRLTYEQFEAAQLSGPSGVRMPTASTGTDAVQWKDNWGCEPYRPLKEPERGSFRGPVPDDLLRRLEEGIRAERDRAEWKAVETPK